MNTTLRLRAAISPGSATSPFTHLRRNYTYAGDHPMPETRIRPPQEIVADLHKRIAAKSPRHAAILAAFERLPREDTPAWDEREEAATSQEIARAKRQARLRRYTTLRLSGTSSIAAARELGLKERTAREYEHDMRAAMKETAGA